MIAITSIMPNQIDFLYFNHKKYTKTLQLQLEKDFIQQFVHEEDNRRYRELYPGINIIDLLLLDTIYLE